MKLLLPVLCFFIFGVNLGAQQKIIVVNPGKDIITNIPAEDVYAHKQFVKGTIQYKKRKVIRSKMNYNVLLDRMQYINSTGDTVSMDDYRFNFIVLESDTFYYDRYYYKFLKKYDKIKLVSRTVFAMINRQKTSKDSLDKLYQIIYNGLFLQGITAKDTLKLVKLESYYMGDPKNVIQTLRRENIIKIYPHRKKALLDYLNNHPVYLDNREEVEKMLDLVIAKS
jgi:hypothetical protein